ncbi:MAG TPA: cobalt-precorrin-6A reductase [Acidisphaera sp.]|nr:cobalt-precorrin-6A reductase [Acidisphaera sp.]
MRLLILGGTTEASALARAVAGDGRVRATLSLAGRTRAPLAQPVPVRVGGFGGSEGLADYLTAHRIDAVIDATHPFASQITANAVAAARTARVPLLGLVRPPWHAQAGDRWQVVSGIAAAAAALGPNKLRVLLTLGRQDLAPFVPMAHHFVLRSIDAPPVELVPPGAEVILARGPFREDDERALLTQRRIDVVVTKNAGGEATRAKLDAARALGLPVVMVARPPLPDCEMVETVQDALAWLDRHADSPRGA